MGVTYQNEVRLLDKEQYIKHYKQNIFLFGIAWTNELCIIRSGMCIKRVFYGKVDKTTDLADR